MKIKITKLLRGALPLVALLSLISCGGGSSTTADPTGPTSTGGAGSGPGTIPRFAFTANAADNSVSSYVVDAASGRLKYIGKVAAGKNPQGVTAHPSGKWAYVANTDDGTISEYQIFAKGGLKIVGAATAGTSPYSVTVDPTGKFAYVANFGSGDVSGYTIDASTGVLAQINCSSVNTTGCATNTTNFAAGLSPQFVTIDPTGKFIYVANYASNDISAYSINSSTGALARINCSRITGTVCSSATDADFATGTYPNSITTDPSGKHAYVANVGDTLISQYTIGADGALTPITSAPTVATNSNPTSVAVDPSGKYAYAANSGGTITQYTIEQTSGALSAMTSAEVVLTGTSPQSITVDPSGMYVYVANNFNGPGGNSVSEYSIGNTGALTPLAPFSVADAAGPALIAIVGGAAPVQGAAKYAYVANYGIAPADGIISQFDVGSDGSLKPMSPATIPAKMIQHSIAVDVDPFGRFAYVWSGIGVLTGYIIGATGGLSLNTAVRLVNPAPGASPTSMTFDPSGRFAYAPNNVTVNTTGNTAPAIEQYEIDQTTGALTMKSSVGASSAPSEMVIDPSGKYAYVLNTDFINKEYSIEQYNVDQATGAMTNMSSPLVVASEYHSIAVDPSGKYVYVSNYYQGNITQYSIGPTGALKEETSTTAVSTDHPGAITIDPSGRYAYVANLNGGNTILQFSITASTGALVTISGTPPVTGTSPKSITIDPSGQYAYVLDSTDTVSQFSIGTDGALTSPATSVQVGTAPAGTGPTSIATAGTWQ